MNPLKLIGIGVMIWASVAAGGCASWFETRGGPLELRSEKTQAVLHPVFTTIVYRATDSNTADIYLTDLPLARAIDPADTLEGVSGNLMHLHVFLVPVAGLTPFDPTACNSTVREAVYSGGAIGLYAGAGFVSTATPGSLEYSADILNASLRLSASTTGFQDLLSPATLSGAFTARLDAKTALALADRLSRLQDSLPVKLAK